MKLEEKLMQELSDYILNDSLEKSSYFNCFNRGNFVGLATCLVLCGLSPIPLKANQNKKEETELNYTCNVKNFKFSEDLEERIKEVRRIFSQKEIVGIALRCGEESNLLILDVDDPEKFNEFYSLEKLKEEAGYVVLTKDEGHYHFGFLYDFEFSKNLNFLKEAGFELKSNGSLVNFYTVLSDYWYVPLRFEDLRRIPEELKEKIKKLVFQKEGRVFIFRKDLTPEIKEKLEKVLNKLYELTGYFPRQRRSNVWRGRCPCHDDREPSLDIEVFGGKIMFKCWAGCSKEDIAKTLGYEESSFYSDRALYIVPRSGVEIVSKNYEPPKWLLEPFLPEGITVIGGKYKIGKSFLALQIACELALRGKKVLYYGLEDTERRLNWRLNLLFGGGTPEFLKNILFHTKEDGIPRLDKGGLEYLKVDIHNFNPDFLVIDPFLAIKPRGKGKDILLEDYQALEIFREFTQKMDILIIHHTRKTQAEDITDELAGSAGFLASPDNVGVLKRDRNSEIGYFTLYPRDFDPQNWALAFKSGRWKVLGKKEEVVIAEEQRKVIEAIKELGGVATIKEVASFLDKNYRTVQSLIFQMVNKGILKKSKRGKYILLR
jgi:predicted transcriptional regulator